MWFRERLKNRRFTRVSVLEVRLRTREVRAARLRLVATALSLALGTLIVLFVVWRAGEWALDRFVFQNEAFAIRELDVQTDGVIPVDTLRRWAGVKPGDNLLALDLNRVKQDLELVPLIGSAAIQRVPPGTLRVRVAERVPIAEVKVPRLRPTGAGVDFISYYLDATGYVVQLSPEDGLGLRQFLGGDSLPQLVGVDGNWLRPGRAVESPAVRAALCLLSAFETSAMFGLVEIRSVDLSQPGVLEVATVQGSRIIFGLELAAEQLAKWRCVHNFASQQGKAIQTLDLSVTNNAPAILLDAGSAPTEPPKLPKASRNRKRHV